MDILFHHITYGIKCNRVTHVRNQCACACQVELSRRNICIGGKLLFKLLSQKNWQNFSFFLNSIITTYIHPFSGCGRTCPTAYIMFMQNTHQIQVLAKPLCRSQAIFYYSLPNNKWGTKYRVLTYSAK